MTDLRIQRTKLAIKNAFIQLLQRRLFKDVSVLDICAQAMINPKTFYKYYANKNALVNELITQFKLELEILQVHRRSSQGDYFSRISLSFFTKHQELLLALWKIDGPYFQLWKDMHMMIKQNFILIAKERSPNKTEQYWDFQAEIFAHTLLKSLEYSFTHIDSPLSELFEQLQEMLNIAKS